jgi:acetyl-CoA/propionyl-CoA carboxylase carboxyl transferase subunit
MTALAASPQSDLPTVTPLDDPRDPMVRIERLGTVTEVLSDEDSVVVAAVLADGVPMIAFATDPRRQGGAMGTAGCQALCAAYELAVERGWAVVGIWHSGGARLTEGVDSLHGVGRVFAAMTLASGKIPQLSLVLGPAAGGAAYGPALTDVVIMGPDGRIFVTGPDVVRSVTGEDVDMARLGGPEPHGRSSGLASVVAATDEEAYAATRRIAALLTGELDRIPVADRPLEGFLPERPARAYDVKPLIAAILDEPPTELHGKWAPNLVTALGTLGGHTVGVLANNPLRLGGCLDAAAGDKAARFVRMCDAFGIPLLVIVDVPGYLPGTGQEWNGVVRRGAKLLHAFAAASVPRITLVTRKAYGGAYIAMNSRALGATHVLAWPKAQVDVMGAIAAVRILHRRQIAAVPDEEKPLLEAQLAEEHLKLSGGLQRAIEGGMVDEIIEPDSTRTRLLELLNEHPSDRGTHGNIPL